MLKGASGFFRVVSYLIVLTFGIQCSVFAQEAQPAPRDAGNTSISTFIKGKYQPKENPFAKLKQKVYMDFQDVGLNEILKLFSQQSGLNFIASDEVKQRSLTLYLSGVSVEEAFNSIMKANSLTYEAISDSIFIVKESRRPKIDTVTRVFNIDYAQLAKFAADGSEQEITTGIKAILEKLITEYGKIQIDARTNSLIVTEIPDQMTLIEEMISTLDTRTKQILIDVQIIETTPGTARRIGFAWGETSVSYTGPSTSSKFPLNRNRYLNDTAAKTASMGTLSMSSFSIVQHMIESFTDVKYIARPKLLTVNNNQAELSVSADQAVGIASSSSSGTGQTTETAERMEIGVTLKVTPQVNKDNYVTLTLEPAVSRAVASPYFSQFIDRHTRSTKSTVMVKDGETIVIAGLIQDEDSKTSQRVPFLGSIPLLGNLFKYDNKSNSQRELMIFLTPHILREDVVYDEIPREQEKRQEVSSGVNSTGIKPEEKSLPQALELKKGIVYPTLREQEGFIKNSAVKTLR
jgi:type IV pilus secretin PilQ/predicted competence protein